MFKKCISYACVCLCQDEEGISSLTDICMTWICHNVEVLCVSQKDGSLQIRHWPLFPQELADQLLHRMADEGTMIT